MQQHRTNNRTNSLDDLPQHAHFLIAVAAETAYDGDTDSAK